MLFAFLIAEVFVFNELEVFLVFISGILVGFFESCLVAVIGQNAGDVVAVCAE